MVYPAPFHRLVIMGTLYADVFNTTLSIVPIPGTGTISMGLVTPTLLADVAAVVGAWWPGAGANQPHITQAARLTGIKLNLIGPDGRYLGPETMEHTYPAPIAGGVSTNPPPQLAVVATIRTAEPRGLASKGRMYLPPANGFYTPLATDGRASDVSALRVATAMTTLFDGINDVYNALPVTDAARGRVGVASDRLAGQFRVATEVSVGRVVDTMRSRRNKLDEAPEFATIPA